MNQKRKVPADSGGLSYRLRVSRRRRTVGLTVTCTGELVVHAPKNLSLKAIQEIVDQNLAWIVKKQAERRAAWDRMNEGQVYYRGQALTLKLSNAGPVGVRLSEGILLVRAAPLFSKEGSGRMSCEAAYPDLWPLLLRWYYQQAKIFLTDRVRHFAPAMGLTPPPLEVRDWRRRWGECHPDGLLRFNWRLVLLPPECLDYLVVHELAHLLVPGHPPRFWQVVAKYLPDYAARRRWLKVYGAPFLHWKLAAGSSSE